MGKFFGTDGIRGKAEMFTGDFLERIVAGLEVGGKRVLIGGDTRESTARILERLEQSLFNHGAKEVGNLGVFPTPGINYAMFALVYDFAIDVTASHNPYTDNGIKIFEYSDAGGVKLTSERCEKIEKELESDSPLMVEFSKEKTEFFDERQRGFENYTRHLQEYIGETKFEDMKIILDCANGATGVVGGEVFRKLGAEVEVINGDTEFGRKINDGVGSTHIEGLVEAVKNSGVEFGAAFDGDGDRCILVDKNGEIVDGDEVIAIVADYFKLDKVVGTVMANQGLLNWGREKGVEVITADVGDQNVMNEMKERGAKVGGEQSGHVILPGEAMGDGMLTTLMVAKIMKETGRLLSELKKTMKKLPQVMKNIPAGRAEKEKFKTEETVESLIEEFSKRLESLNGRVLVRPSGTEELIRITVWGEDQGEIEKIAEELGEKLIEELKND